MTHPPYLLPWAPYHTLRSFNYLMQDVGIRPGRHLKGALSFIWWDASSMRTEKRFAWVPQTCWCPLQRCVHASVFFFPFSFFPFLAAFLHTILCNNFSTCRWGYAAPRRYQATSRDGRLTWAETTMTTSLVTASGSKICTPGIVCTV